MNRLYAYRGPVEDYFGKLLDRYYSATTWASSKKQAKNNLMFRYKEEHNLSSRSKIIFTNEVVQVQEATKKEN